MRYAKLKMLDEAKEEVDRILITVLQIQLEEDDAQNVLCKIHQTDFGVNSEIDKLQEQHTDLQNIENSCNAIIDSINSILERR